MKIKLLNTFVIALGLLGVLPVLNSCDDFLDRQPLDKVGPAMYLNTETDLASYPIAYYTSMFSTHGGFGLGVGASDNATDNQAATDPNLNRYEVGKKLVAQDASLGLGNIRGFNFFFREVLPKWQAGKITGDPANIKQYIGEVYMLRALEYFNKLKTYGDFPIIKTVLPDQNDVLVDAAKRAPRNMVARQIISDLDSAILLLKSSGFTKVRLTREAALLAKSRVALYEASYLTFHKGTPRVPGEAGWPGATMSFNKDFKINLATEITYFLDQAMSASKEVADAVALTTNSGVFNPTKTKFAGWNPYFEMFGSKNLAGIPEVLFWRQYNLSLNTTHGVSIYVERGGNSGLTKSFVDSYLMKNGLPIYATGSGYQGDVTINKVKTGRDDRLNLFLFGETDLVTIKKATDDLFVGPLIINLPETRDVTGYRARKYLNYDPTEAPGSDLTCVSGMPIYRVAEAYLNYIEASYMKSKSIDGTAAKYWQALRTRAGVDIDFNKTIAATDMSREKNDWGAYSGGVLVDATLYNIRRERRSEFVSEGMRYDDLMRWRAMDQVKNYIVEGFNLWDAAYLGDIYTKPKPGEITAKGLVDNGTSTANVSSRTLSKYVRPYQVVNLATNTVFNGYNWSEANYLEPFAYRQMQLASPDQDAANSNLYQNPYWPALPSAKALR